MYPGAGCLGCDCSTVRALRISRRRSSRIASQTSNCSSTRTDPCRIVSEGSVIPAGWAARSGIMDDITGSVFQNMPKLSAGLLMYRHKNGALEVFLVHPGGPFWARKDTGAWSIPKGEYAEGEPPLEAAKREFHEETGFEPAGNFVELGTAKQGSGKLVSAWAV